MQPFDRCVYFEQDDPTLLVPRILNVGHERVCDPNYYRKGGWPRFDYNVFQYTLAGQGYVRSHGGVHSVPPGHGFLVNLRDPSMVYGCPPKASEAWEFVYMSFAGGSSDELVAEMVRRHGVVVTLPPGNEIERYILNACSTVAPSTILLMRTFETSAPVLTLMDLIGWHQTESMAESESLLVRRGLELIRKRLHSPYNAKMLASELGFSREHLARQFKKRTGKTPHDVIVEAKMKEALRLLRTTFDSNLQIARRLGFSNAQNFARLFKQQTGTAPQQFRNAAGGNRPTSPLDDRRSGRPSGQ